MALPTQSDVASFVDVVQCDEATAVKFLQGANHDIGTAISDYFDNPNKYDHSGFTAINEHWDESAFGQGRAGEDVTSNIPSFQIHPADATIGPNSSAPTRPPSRISNRSHNSQQETGVVDNAGRPYFGPATRDNYDPSQWALTVPASTAAEILIDPNPADRKRDFENGEPVFMKPLPSKDALPCLITILGHIPLARQSMIFRCDQLPDYGSDREWWKGAKIILPRIVHLDEPVPLDQYWDVLHETQRLMAFIHASTRSYGSVEALSTLPALSEVDPGQAETKTVADRFLVAWSKAAEIVQAKDASSLFLTVATSASPSKEPESIQFWTIDLTLSRPPGNATARTLYDALDDSLWENDEDGESDTNFFLREVPPILVVRVTNPDSSRSDLGLRVPLTWYSDRYLEENVGIAKTMRKSRFDRRQQLQRIEERRQKLLKVKHPKDDRKTISTEELFSGAIGFLNPPIPTDGDADNGTSTAQPVEPHCVELANQLSSLYERLQQKLKDLENEREKTEKQLEILSRLMTDPNMEEQEELKPKHMYTLRGVALGPRYDTTYVLVDPDHAVNPGGEGQWWKTEYSYNSVTKNKITRGAVLNLATRTREVLLVYATDEAIKGADFDLPDQLRKFVSTDNKFFAEEISEYEANPPVDSSWTDQEQNPPAYSAADGDWPPNGAGWVPDPGANAGISDAEYRANTDYNANIGVASGPLSATAGPPSMWEAYWESKPDKQSLDRDLEMHDRSDANMTTETGAEHIEDVVKEKSRWP